MGHMAWAPEGRKGRSQEAQSAFSFMLLRPGGKTPDIVYHVLCFVFCPLYIFYLAPPVSWRHLLPWLACHAVPDWSCSPTDCTSVQFVPRFALIGTKTDYYQEDQMDFPLSSEKYNLSDLRNALLKSEKYNLQPD